MMPPSGDGLAMVWLIYPLMPPQVRYVLHRCDTPQHGLQPDAMALITLDFDAMRSPSIKWA